MHDETIDEALVAMQGRAPLWSGPGFLDGNTHGPMMIETLVTLGRPEAVMPWVEKFGHDGPEAPAPRVPITKDWRGALGEGRRYGDWQVFFRSELAKSAWPEIVGKWVGRLLPGMASAGAHGVIRVAHGVRSLARGESEPRLAELVDGLSNWAAHYYELPRLRGEVPGLRVSEALESLRPLLVPGTIVNPVDPGPGTTTQQLQGLAEARSFHKIVGRVSFEGDADRFLGGLLRAFGLAFMSIVSANPRATTSAVHCVTVPSAVRMLLPYLPLEKHRSACVNAWHTAAAIYATSGGEGPAPEPLPERLPDRDDLIDRAVALGDAHAVKFVEACWRAFDTDGARLLPLAAAIALEKYESGDPDDE